MKPAVTLATASVVLVAMLVALLTRCDRGSASRKLAAAKRALERGDATLALRLAEEAEDQLDSSEDALALGFAAGLCRTRALIALGQGSRAVGSYRLLAASYTSLATEEDDQDILFALLESEDHEAALSLITWAIANKRGPVELYRTLDKRMRSIGGEDVMESKWSWWAWASPPEVDFAAYVMYRNGR